MSNTIICPVSWFTYMETNYNQSRNPIGDNDIWVGWDSRYSKVYVPIVKFNTSGLSVISLSMSISAKMFFRSGDSGASFVSPIDCTVWELIKPATVDAHWTKYDLINYWTSPGASAPDSDYKSTALGAFTISTSNTWYYIEMGAQAIRSLYTSDRPIMITPPAGLPGYSITPIRTRPYYPQYQPYIEVTYSSGFAGDATIF